MRLKSASHVDSWLLENGAPLSGGKIGARNPKHGRPDTTNGSNEEYVDPIGSSNEVKKMCSKSPAAEHLGHGFPAEVAVGRGLLSTVWECFASGIM